MAHAGEQLEEQFLAAVRAGDAAAAAACAAEWTSPRPGIFAAAALGDQPAVAAALRAGGPDAVHATHGPEHWTPLAYACRSPLASLPARAAGLRAVAATLLDAGARLDRAAVFVDASGGEAPLSALYFACLGNHVPLVELLLARGADWRDGESIYHAAQLNHRDCLEALRRHGADFSAAQAPWGNTPLYFLCGHESDHAGAAPWFQGLEWLLQHGADPNVPSTPSRQTPLHLLAASLPAKPLTAARLLAFGADPAARRHDGRTPLSLALRHGNRPLADLLRTHGAAQESPSPEDQLFAACLDADGPRAEALLRQHPGLLASLGPAANDPLHDAVRLDSAPALQLMVRLGFPLDRIDHDFGTPLHEAAWRGFVQPTRTLLALGAPLDLRDRQFHGTPLVWAAHGSREHPGNDTAYIEIVAALLAAGAAPALAANAPHLATPAVAAYLRAHGWA